MDWFYKFDISLIYAVAIVLIAGAAEFGTWTGLRRYQARADNSDINTLASAALGLLALLLVMSMMIATLIVLVMDLDRPYRGLIRVSEQALVDVAKSLGP